MKAKVIATTNDPQGLEEQLNVFLETIDPSQIVSITQAQSGRLDKNRTVVVVYTEE